MGYITEAKICYVGVICGLLQSCPFRSARSKRGRDAQRHKALVFSSPKSGVWSARPTFLHFAAICFLGLVSLGSVARAQESAALHPEQSAAEPAATRIEVDEQAHVIRIFINGQEKARLDAAGLHVRESIDYGGVLTDYGTGGFDNRAGRKEYLRLKAEDPDAP